MCAIIDLCLFSDLFSLTLMTSIDYTERIDTRLRELELLEIDRDRLAGEIEDLRALRRGATLREEFEREYACLYKPVKMELL